MKNLNIKAFLWIAAPLTIFIWVLFFYFTEGGDTFRHAIKIVPAVVTIDFILWLIFVKWMWKWRVFQDWLVPFPILEGTWTGDMKSTWADPTTKTAISTLPFTLVIRQSFLSISCSIYTEESCSISYSSDIILDKESRRTQLIYNYTNRPQASARNRSEIHDGTVLLTLMGDKHDVMKGEYWTSRKTTGDIEAKLSTRKVKEGFYNKKTTKGKTQAKGLP